MGAGVGVGVCELVGGVGDDGAALERSVEAEAWICAQLPGVLPLGFRGDHADRNKTHCIYRKRGLWIANIAPHLKPPDNLLDSFDSFGLQEFIKPSSVQQC